MKLFPLLAVPSLVVFAGCRGPAETDDPKPDAPRAESRAAVADSALPEVRYYVIADT